ncbi:MAG: hypothetical protein AB7K71_40935 [Polyangiaceae bacterium]
MTSMFEFIVVIERTTPLLATVAVEPPPLVGGEPELREWCGGHADRSNDRDAAGSERGMCAA